MRVVLFSLSVFNGRSAVGVAGLDLFGAAPLQEGNGRAASLWLRCAVINLQVTTADDREGGTGHA